MNTIGTALLDPPETVLDHDSWLPFSALDAAMSALPVLALVVDWKGDIVQCSRKAADLLGLADGDGSCGRSLSELSERCDLEYLFARAMAAAGDDAEPVRDVVRFEREPGQVLALTVSAMPLPAQRGVLMICEDASERGVQQEQDLHSRKLQAIGRLAAGIAHEINTPMQYVAANVLYLRDALEPLLVTGPRASERGPFDRERVAIDLREALDESIHGIEQVATIVKAMKAFSHPATSTLEAVDLNRVVEAAVVVTRSEWKYIADMVLDLDPRTPTIEGSSGELHQVLLNLIVNAAHAVEDAMDGRRTKGRIEIATRKDGAFAEVVVADSGCGIPDSVRDRMFEPFFTTKEIGRGTGQGLAFVHSIVCDRHRGGIDVWSRVDSGTRFRLRLPSVSRR